MLNSVHLNYFVRKSSVDPSTGAVCVKVTVNKKRVSFGSVMKLTGSKTSPSLPIEVRHWDAVNGRVLPGSPYAKELNRAIAECSRRIDKVHQQHEAFDRKMTLSATKAIIMKGVRMLPTMADLTTAYLVERAATGTKPATVATYEFKLRNLLRFLAHEKTEGEPAENFSPGALKRYRTWLITHRGNAHRCADKSCQVVKTLLLWAVETERIDRNPLLNVRIHVDKTPNLTFLSREEVGRIESASLPVTLRKAADCFLFSCYTGIAYQDMCNLTGGSIQVVEGRRCLVGKRQKTGTEFIVPITEPVQCLIATYGGPQMPLPENRKYNSLLKHLMLSLGIDKSISSHSARKTFADWCLNELGMSQEATIVAMGQKGVRELEPYARVRAKRLMSEFPVEATRVMESPRLTNPCRIAGTPFSRVA